MNDFLIDWSRMARPQNDGYDSQIVLQFAEEKGFRRKTTDGYKTIFEDRIAIRHWEKNTEVDEWAEQGDLEHPNFDIAADLLRIWPEGFNQFVRLMDTIYPMTKVKVSTEAFPNLEHSNTPLVLGSSSHSEGRRFGSMYVTTYDPIGTAQAFVHELAHQKLRALGFQVEQANILVCNSPDELFESPVRKDKLRPMTAIVHATYSWIYITELNVHWVQDALTAGKEKVVIDLYAHYLYKNLPRLYDGIKLISEHAIVDKAGEKFFTSLLDWYNEIVERVQQFEVLKVSNV
ncbi:MAG: HEXXH motif-containing putative peptide modification protein [Saprospiraceae bacterium]|nr:hypothetical protein [Lewinella sp.]